MHLKSLTLKGFKSFASPTTLRFEPGITCVVGPNGSGKSNVVDALTWVMGEQGAKTLRGGKMEDVIFAGTSSRAPLGRAEVTLTIDNSDNALPIEYSEVSITRRMFRDGAGEYEINGSSCRLMDVQELLSDSGIGREMHVIVGQGKLSEILESRPEDRRAFIEEAAGVLKHRKRKEKAVRKLDSMSANLARLTDLTTELRRQLKPLGRQAEMARRAQTIQADLRDARLRLAADDLVTRKAEFDDTNQAETTLRREHDELTERMEARTLELDAHESAVADLSERADAAQQRWFRLSALAERVSATVRIASERAQHLDAEPDFSAGPDPDELEAQADAVAEQEQLLLDELAESQARLESARAELGEREQAAAEAERAHMAAARAEADRREGLARLSGQVDTMRTRVDSVDETVARLTASIDEAGARAQQTQAEFETVQGRVAELDSGEVGLDEHHDRTIAALRLADERVTELQAAERAAERRVASLQARIDALSVGLDRKDGAAWLKENRSGAGLFDSLANLVKVRPGHEAAIAAVLGAAADALAAENSGAARDALAALKESDGGRAAIVLGDWPARTPATGQLPAGAAWAVDLVDPAPRIQGAVTAMLGGVAVVGDLTAALELVAAQPELRAVTADGDLVGAGWVSGGSDRKPSTLEITSEVDKARAELVDAERQTGELSAALSGALAEQAARQDAAEQALAALNESDAAISAIYEQLGRLGQDARAADDEWQRLIKQRDELEAGRNRTVEELAELESRLHNAQQEPMFDVEVVDRTEFTAAAEAARSAEVEARLAVRTAEERANAVRGRADSLRRAAVAEREARARAQRAREARVQAAAVAAAVAESGRLVAQRLADAVAVASRIRDEVAAERHVRAAALTKTREEVAELTARIAALTDSLHRDEVAKAQAALRIEQLEQQVLEQFGIAVADLIAEYGPDVPLPPSELEMAEYEQAKERGEQVTAPAPMPYDRPTQERRAKRADKELRELGRVNPLALEEFAALEERYNFLSTQLEDVKAARKDLLDVIADVDSRILQVFTEAYMDVEREFTQVFSTLFPGGEGRLLLTDPSDMLTTGIEVEARPPGKKIKRLSLLSGGEKSLTAVAMLVAIFRARPSPFYVMDEVEAALDDVNLRRLISLFEQLRERSQLIVITHQKPTMEVADALYGVTMRGDGITTVISQRMRGQELVASPS
ncbi:MULTISPECIES: chromosome segregation protein SMC [Mycolicibacterium]|jgi:chromosome segregation protein|uniref:chromosome segregation protein SMC n=2 Tax=Mycobacteriaceae TaxID=1762 RepID=UPI00056A2394|nr:MULTISPECIES: chromosome segregation protein SMC [Mycolicibacterium]MDW5614741.1 chromosome segregation protein SMC [Mycolicibacterium sp. D5.8-2]QZT58967.1 chromosome segregation protein SMC [Mycolicibacterium austroafricanum]QZY48226.1 chromosome segregation protein SMC [Mycolicibacterium austroafricanum]UJL26736.1 chromosome segregation protein SMC [Mycolicibacterium vanbaalenii]WND58847.1 chromosome segregation protein SMC [Mycolicibacterium vanbaalenii]